MSSKRQKYQRFNQGQGIINPSREGSCPGNTYLQEALRFEKHPPLSLLTAEQVSQLFNLKTRQVTELARQGKIPAIKIGKLWRFPEESLREWIRENQEPCASSISQEDIDLVVDDIITDVNHGQCLSKARG